MGGRLFLALTAIAEKNAGRHKQRAIARFMYRERGAKRWHPTRGSGARTVAVEVAEARGSRPDETSNKLAAGPTTMSDG